MVVDIEAELIPTVTPIVTEEVTKLGTINITITRKVVAHTLTTGIVAKIAVRRITIETTMIIHVTMWLIQ